MISNETMRELSKVAADFVRAYKDRTQEMAREHDENRKADSEQWKERKLGRLG